MNNINRQLVKGQSILEYLIVLSTVVVGIMIGTMTLVGLDKGVQDGLDRAEGEIGNILRGEGSPATVRDQDYYTPSRTQTSFEGEQYQTDPYGGPEHSDDYYFHEGESDMSHVPPAGTILKSD